MLDSGAEVGKGGMEEITSHLFAQELPETHDQIQVGRLGRQEQELDIELLGKGADRIRPLVASTESGNFFG